MEAAWRQTGPSFWPTAGRDLTIQRPQPPGRPKRLDPNWAGSKGRATAAKGAATRFLHKPKSFLSSHASSGLPLKPLNLPSLHARQIGKGSHSQFPCHHTDSFMHKSFGAGGRRLSARSVYDLHIERQWSSLFKRIWNASDRSRP
jgi:hypothetical protein